MTDGPTGNGEGDYMDDMKTVLPESDPKRMIELTDKTISFMSDQVKNNKPFFVQLSHYAFTSGTIHLRKPERNTVTCLRAKKAMDSDYLPESKFLRVLTNTIG